MILNEIVAPENVGDDLIQVISTTHIDEYMSLPTDDRRHLDGALVREKADEAALAAYAIFVKDRAQFQGVAKSASTGLGIAFSMEPHQSQPRTVCFVMITAMMKRNFMPSKSTDVLIKISNKQMTFDDKPCVEVGRNTYARADGFAFDEGANAGGVLQEIVVADIDRQRAGLRPGFTGTLGTEDGYVSYVVEVDTLGNVFLERAWWKNLMRFAAVEVG